ncbi:hypothetical protein FHETE_10815 [Fusarium heterosporum]|uniref:Uncharacterized protein n=1 Tax=Fusarium heterosporum TaxID=42747 RepID=A0A8H5STI9_FUSHE|nr:hypothetical protein FHETE_10815 [Fusarium heterosporum]
MAFPDSSPGTSETDPTYHTLQTPAQRSLALKIKRYAGQFPWEIVPLCSKTTWTQGVLDKFAELLIKVFSGQLSSLDTRRLRSVLMSSVERKDLDKRQILLQSDVVYALTELKKADSRHDNKTPRSAKKRGRPPSTNKQTESPKRVRVKEETPRAVTRSSGRLRGDSSINVTPLSPQTPVPIKDVDEGLTIAAIDDTDMEDNTIEVEQPDDDETEEEQQDDQVATAISEELQESARQNDFLNDYHDVEESILDTAPTSTPTPSFAEGLNTSSARRIQVAVLDMTDEELGNRLRQNLSLMATRMQNARDRRQAELEAVYEEAKLVFEKANQSLDDLLEAHETLRLAHESATADTDKARVKHEKATAVIKLAQELGADGAMETLLQTLEEAQQDQENAEAVQEIALQMVSNRRKEVEAARRAVDDAKTNLFEVDRLLTNFMNEQLQERRINCTITMGADASNEDGNNFGDLTFKLAAAIRQQVNGEELD